MSKQTPILYDLSSNNGKINYEKFVAAMQPDSNGKKHVCLRLTMGMNSVDTMVAEYAKHFAALGVGISYYHLGYPTTKGTTDNSAAGNGVIQAIHIMDTIKNLALPKPEAIMVDLEDVKIADLPKLQYFEWCKAILERIDTLSGLSPIIYSPTYWIDGHLPKGHGLWKTYRLWLPNYNHVTTPPLPADCPEAYMWQYSSTEVVPGDNGHVDVSCIAEGRTFPI